MQVLSRGLNFAPTPRFIPKAHIVASVETATSQSGVTEDQATRARIGVVGVISRARLPPRSILPENMKAVKELTKDEEIVILPEDKGPW